MPMMDDDDVGLTSSYGELAHERLVYACMVSRRLSAVGAKSHVVNVGDDE
jgi:hypothetical protein